MMRYLFISISLIIISCSPVRKYQTLPAVLSWEKEIQKFENLDINESYPEDAILFAGSSSIKLWDNIDKDMAPYPVIQRGYGGARLSDFAVYADRIIGPHPCKAIVLFVANDIAGRDQDISPEEVTALFRYTLKTIRKTHPSTPVFWIEVTPTASRWNVWPEIQKSTVLIEKACNKLKNTYLIRTTSAFLNKEGKPIDELFRSDKLHLTKTGYAVWTKIIKNELKNVIGVPAVEIIGHRGASHLAPENSIASAKLAWEKGADAVEIDIHLSKDNRIIVMHDANTRRTTGENHQISDTESEILKKLDIGTFKDEKYKGEKIPFIEDIIHSMPAGKELVVEIKCKSEVLPYLKEEIDKHGKDKKFVFICFDFQTISDTKKTFPDNPCYWLCGNKDVLSEKIEQVPESGVDGLSLSYKIIDKKVAAKTKELGLELFTWTVDDQVEAKRLISLGVKGITTNRPGWLRRQIYNN
jgi:glycerophosphoryl diester phosphodiesterase